ncbi:MAG: hypothetical protein IPJ74_25385 [Saprospiraceae bacterium]|nr:hypothetical protein [Saprospiraceae bacterium]
MDEIKTIVVCGATWQTRWCCIDALLKTGKWNLIAFSRNINGQKAEAIKRKVFRFYKLILPTGNH